MPDGRWVLDGSWRRWVRGLCVFSADHETGAWQKSPLRHVRAPTRTWKPTRVNTPHETWQHGSATFPELTANRLAGAAAEPSGWTRPSASTDRSTRSHVRDQSLQVRALTWYSKSRRGRDHSKKAVSSLLQQCKTHLSLVSHPLRAVRFDDCLTDCPHRLSQGRHTSTSCATQRSTVWRVASPAC